MKSFTTIISAILFLSAVACTSNEIGYSKDVNPETVFMDYYVNYEEGEDSAECFLQYRFAGENGTTLVLSEPSMVAIDDIPLKADSTDFSGAYYEKKFAAAAFEGDHTIAFTDINGKTRTEVFNFHRIKLADDILPATKQCDFVLNFKNLQPRDMIEINISDTSGATDDITVSAIPIKGKLTVAAEKLKTLSSGPCKIQVYKNSTNPLQQPTAEGGRISITYLINETTVDLKDNATQATATL